MRGKQEVQAKVKPKPKKKETTGRVKEAKQKMSSELI
jgi:hypothetical protein